MPWLPMYVLGPDRELVIDRFNGDRSIAWLVGAGTRRWRAVDKVDHAPPDRRIGLWHVPSGPLPLLPADPSESPGTVVDPWAGWEELRTGADPLAPYFGAGHPGVYWLTLRDTAHSLPIEVSGVGWIGNYYASIGRPAAPDTERHWRALRRWATRIGTRIPRSGPVDGPRKEIVAFPTALAAIRGGRARLVNPTTP